MITLTLAFTEDPGPRSNFDPFHPTLRLTLSELNTECDSCTHRALDGDLLL